MHTKLASPSKNLTRKSAFRCDITETPNRPSLSICGQFTLRYTRVNAVSANQRRAKEGEIPDHLIIHSIALCVNSMLKKVKRVKKRPYCYKSQNKS